MAQAVPMMRPDDQMGGGMPPEMMGMPPEMMGGGMAMDQGGQMPMSPEEEMMMAQEQGMGGAEMSPMGFPKPTSIEELTDRFTQIEQEAPEIAEDVMQGMAESGLQGDMLESIGILCVMAILKPEDWPAILQEILQMYPQESVVFTEDYEDSLEDLYEIAFAAFLNEGGEI